MEVLMASEKVQEWNELNFQSAVLEERGTVLVDFTAEWCPPCKALAPVVANVAAAMWGRVVVGSVNADDCPNIAARFGIRGLPTLIVFHDGKEIARRVGLTNESGVRALLEPALAAQSSAVA
jgi:thioredoxin 1